MRPVERGEKFVRSDGQEYEWNGVGLVPTRRLDRCVKRLLLFTEEVDLWLHARLVLHMLPDTFLVTAAFQDTEHLGLVLVIQSDEFPEVPEHCVPEMANKTCEWEGMGPEAIKVVHVS